MGALVLFFSSFLTVTTYGAPQSHPIFILYNQDRNLTHSVQVSVSNASDSRLFNTTYTLIPGDNASSDIGPTETYQNYTFTVRVDGTITSYVTMSLGPTNLILFEIYSPEQKEAISYSVIDLTPSGQRHFIWETE